MLTGLFIVLVISSPAIWKVTRFVLERKEATRDRAYRKELLRKRLNEARRTYEQIGKLQAVLEKCSTMGVTYADLDLEIASAANGEPTEWERVRERSMKSIVTYYDAIQTIRKNDVLEPNQVRAREELRKLHEACGACPEENSARLASGQPFVCAATSTDEPVDGFRFYQLSGGRIIGKKSWR